MLGLVPELVGVEGVGSETEAGSGVGTEAGTEVLCKLVSSKEDTMDRTGREVTEPWTDTIEGLGSDGGVGRESVWSRKVTLCLTQSINRLCRVNQQVQVQQENHDPTWLMETGSAEEFHKGT